MGLASWLLPKDHKRIAIMYLISISVFVFIGGLTAVGIRLELATPQGDFVQAKHKNVNVIVCAVNVSRSISRSGVERP